MASHGHVPGKNLMHFIEDCCSIYFGLHFFQYAIFNYLKCSLFFQSIYTMTNIKIAVRVRPLLPGEAVVKTGSLDLFPGQEQVNCTILLQLF